LFPPDDGDGVLDRGLLPYVTVYSWDFNSANDNKPRININAYKFANVDKLPDAITEVLSPDLIDFLAEAQKRMAKAKNQFFSVGELLGLQVYEDGSTNYDAAWKEYDKARKAANKVSGAAETQPAEEGEKGSQDKQGGTTTQGSGRGGKQAGGSQKGAKGGTTGQNQQGKATTQGSGRGRSGGARGTGATGGRNFGGTGQDASQNTGKGDQGSQQGSQQGGQQGRQGTNPRRGGSRGQRDQSGQQTDRQAQKDSQGGDQRSPSDERKTDNVGEDENKQQGQTPRDKNRTRRQRSTPKSSKDQQGDATDTRQANEDTSSVDGKGTKAGTTDDMQSSESKADQQADQSDQARKEQEGDQTKSEQEGSQAEEKQAGSETAPGQESEEGKDTAEGEATEKSRGTPVVSPVTAEDMAVLMDRLTVSTQPIQIGLINVNTAASMVLKAIPGLTDEEAQAIASRRGQIGGEDKATPAWLVSAGVLDPAKFALICNQITARSLQFSIDVVGYADHVGAIQRVQAVVEMQGQLSQVKYYRDITSLGAGYPLDGDQRSEGFEYDDRR